MLRKCLLLLIVLLMAALPACAEGAPVFGGDLQLTHTANNALAERYGLTPLCFGLFDVQISHFGDAAIVHYTPHSRPHPSLTGEYVVLITPEDVHALWSHDDADPALWQSGDLNSPAWGVRQLTAYLAESSFTREHFDAPYIRQPLDEPAAEFRTVFSYDVGGMSKTQIAEPLALARSAVQVMYGLSDDEASRMQMLDVMLLLSDDGPNWWVVDFYHRAELDEANYTVRIDADTNVILDIRINTGGIG